MPSAPRPILLLTQGFAGDRLGSRLAPALRVRFPERELIGIGGGSMSAAGVRLLARTDTISAMGYSGVLPQLPKAIRAMLLCSWKTRRPLPACVIAVDVWQPLRLLHRTGPHLAALPHICYLPPAPNFIGESRVHGRVARAFRCIVTPFAHQQRLYRAAGGTVVAGGHAGLQAAREEAAPLPAEAREDLLALLPGSRALEVRYGLRPQLAAAELIRKRHPRLEPLVCCASEPVERAVRREFPGVRCARNAREILARARFALICSGTAALEAAVLGCPGVVTYHGSPLQGWEWRRFHEQPIARLRQAGIASAYIALPNIIAGEELYSEQLDAPAAAVAEAALQGLGRDPEWYRAALDRVSGALSWEHAGDVIAREVEKVL